MNLNVVPQLLGRISNRTKLIAVGIVAFLLGLMLAGRGAESVNGRYVPWGENYLLDTRSGDVWVIDANHRFKKYASLPYF